MKVELLIPRSGAKGSFNVGDHVEVSDEEGKRLCEAGKARPVQSTKRRKANNEPEEIRSE